MLPPHEPRASYLDADGVHGDTVALEALQALEKVVGVCGRASVSNAGIRARRVKGVARTDANERRVEVPSIHRATVLHPSRLRNRSTTPRKRRPLAYLGDAGLTGDHGRMCTFRYGLTLWISLMTEKR